MSLPGIATDIGVGANGTVCVIGPNGQVFRRNSANTRWVNLQRQGSRIDVNPQGRPWIVNSANEIYKYNGNRWVLVPGAAQDITIGANGSIYIVGPDPLSEVLRWNGSGWTSLGREAYRVTADAAGNVWITNYEGDVSKYNLASGVWEDMVGPNRIIVDIGAGPSGIYAADIAGGILKLGNNKWFIINKAAEVGGPNQDVNIDAGVSGASYINVSQGGAVYSF